MKITREFAPADRYLYDFGLCSYANGWAQVDTAQDASCFGTWAHPTRLLIFTYSSGDTTLKEAGSPPGVCRGAARNRCVEPVAGQWPCADRAGPRSGDESGV